MLDSEVKLNGSYTWQSIVQARLVVQKGSTCCIGDGHQDGLEQLAHPERLERPISGWSRMSN